MHTLYISFANYWVAWLSSCLPPVFLLSASLSPVHMPDGSPVEFTDIAVECYSWSFSGLPLVENRAGLVSEIFIM